MIALSYLLVLNVPLIRYRGGYWADPLWKKDLEAHRTQIADLAIACPVTTDAPPPHWERLAAGLAVHPLPAMGRFAALLAPYLAVRLWRAVGRAGIVHVGLAGWPFPLGWLAIPIARRRRRPVVLVIESAFWRIPPGTPASPLARLRARLWEGLNARATAACDVSFFTTRAYRDELHRGRGGTAHVLPAVWIDDDQLIDPARLTAIAPARRGRLLFAGRLTAAKGVGVLLAAAERSGVAVDLVGEGDLRETVLAASRRRPDLIRLLDPVAYGAAFAALIDRYAALVVPTLSDEQPRVIFDAFARGAAVIASATGGNGQIVEQGRTGLLVAPGDVDALAAALVEARDDPDHIARMGTAARHAMTKRTHAAMHAERARLIEAALARHGA